MTILEKTILALQNNKSDKKFIYRMLFNLGKKYSGWIDSIVEKLSILDQMEQNIKSITYKAKMIFCFQWWISFKSRDHLPIHFSRHMLYIQDV